MKSKIDPRVTLVGAGPGSEDLMTLRGLRALQDADMVLYDALISDKLLLQIGMSTPKIYVGKRCSRHTFTGGHINTLIVENAFRYGHVVR